MCNFFTKLDVSCFHYFFSNHSHFHNPFLYTYNLQQTACRYFKKCAIESLLKTGHWIETPYIVKFDKKQNTFVEPYLPNHEIGIIHLAGKNNDNIRNDKNHVSKIETLDGEIIEKSLRYGN